MNGSYVIGISGGSGSGKTTIVNLLRKKYSVEDVCIVSQDDYYRKREEQKVDENGISNFDLPHSIRIEDFVQDVRRLIHGETIKISKYTFNNSLAEEKHVTLKPANIIIIEGLFVFHFNELRDFMNLKVFVDASDVVKVKRRILRDRVERNYPLDDVLYRYEKHVLPSYLEFIHPFRSHADIVLNNEESYEVGLEVLKGFIDSKLHEKLNAIKS